MNTQSVLQKLQETLSNPEIAVRGSNALRGLGGGWIADTTGVAQTPGMMARGQDNPFFSDEQKTNFQQNPLKEVGRSAGEDVLRAALTAGTTFTAASMFPQKNKNPIEGVDMNKPFTSSANPNQKALEQAWNSGDVTKAQKIIDLLDDNDPYKASMQSIQNMKLIKPSTASLVSSTSSPPSSVNIDSFDSAVDSFRSPHSSLNQPEDKMRAIDDIYKFAKQILSPKEMKMHKTVDDVIEAVQGKYVGPEQAVRTSILPKQNYPYELVPNKASLATSHFINPIRQPSSLEKLKETLIKER